MPSLSFLSLSKHVVTKTVMAHVSQHSYLLELLSRDFVCNWDIWKLAEIYDCPSTWQKVKNDLLLFE